jgi:hypothetical protein
MGEAGASRAAGHRVAAAQLTIPGGTAYVPVTHLLSKQARGNANGNCQPDGLRASRGPAAA